MMAPARFARGNYTVVMSKTEEDQEISDMAASVAAVEKILNYRFNKKKLLEDALTHPSFTESASYQRLEFVGDAALGLAFSNYVYLAYPELEPGKLSLVRAANISTEHLARVSVRKRLYNYVRHNAAALDDKVREFVTTVNQEDGGEAVYGGKVKAPKVLADIVESVAAAVYVDCNFDLKAMWPVIKELLEPLVMLDVLEHQPQPVTLLFEICQKDGKQVGIDYARDGEKNVAIVTVDGQFVAKASSVQKEHAKLNAAKAALEKLCPESSNMAMAEDDTSSQPNRHITIEGAKQKLHEICGKKKWPRPKYKIIKEFGREHDKRYVCSVEIEVAECILVMTSQEKMRVREAENCAASSMIHSLRDTCYL